MKLYGYECLTSQVDSASKLISDLGLTIFKKVTRDDYSYISWNIEKTLIIFVVPDAETEIMLKLKFPADTFIECMYE